MVKAINGWTKDKMKAHIKLEFKGKSEDAKGNCLYRGPNGKKCAVGIFIPDDRYHPSMDSNSNNGGVSISLLMRKFDLSDIMPLGELYLYDLQRTHDNSSDPNTLDDMIVWIDKNVED